MAGKTNRWKLGLFVLTGVVLAAAIVVWLGAGRRHEVLTIQCYFDEPVHGLDVGSIVSHRGVPIGVVSKIRMAEEDPLRQWICVDIDVYWDVLVVLTNFPPELRDRTSLPPLRDLAAGGGRVWRAELQSSLLTGVTYIQTDLFDASKHPTPKYPFDPPPNTLHTVPSGARILKDDLVKALDAIPIVAERLKETLGSVDKLIATTEQAIADLRVDDLSKRLDRLLADADEAIAQMDLPGTARSVRETLGHVDPAADDAGRLASDLRNEIIYLRRMLESITRLADSLDRDPSSLLRGREAREPIQERK